MLVTKYAVKCVKEKSFQYYASRKFRSPGDVFKLFIDALRVSEEPVENVWVVAMNGRHEMLGYTAVSRGGMTQAPVHPRSVFQFLLNCNALAGIIVHNHPSGDPEPSDSDIDVTRRLVEAGKIMGIEIADHIVIGEYGFVSLKERGYFLTFDSQKEDADV
jgi:DNA repair protein RadC